MQIKKIESFLILKDKEDLFFLKEKDSMKTCSKRFNNKDKRSLVLHKHLIQKI